MNIRKRNGRYTVQVRRLGFKSITKTFAQKSDAHKWGRQVEVQLEQKRYKDISNASKTTLRSVLERHLTERMKLVRAPKKERARFNTICKSKIVEKFLSELMPGNFAEYRDKRIEESAAPATVIRELSFMSVAISKAIKIYNCWIPEHPIQNSIRPKEAAPRNRRLENGEYDRLKEYCKGAPKFKKPSPYWCDTIDFTIESALRLNELLSLCWKNISMVNKTMKIEARHTKTNTERIVPLTPKAILVLQRIPRSIDGRVFPMSINNFNRGWRAICKNASITGLRWHDLRREACSRLLESGLSISEVQLFTGHKTVSLMLKTYSAHNPIKIAKKLNS